MRPGFSPLRGLIQQGLQHYHLEQGVKAAQAVNVWDRVAGPVVAAVTQADSVRDGVLHVFTRSNAWSQELGMLREQLVAGVNKELGAEAVKDIRFRVKRIVKVAAEVEKPRSRRTLPSQDRTALDELAARLEGEFGAKFAGMAEKQLTRAGHEGACPECGGPLDVGHSLCPFCR